MGGFGGGFVEGSEYLSRWDDGCGKNNGGAAFGKNIKIPFF
jgi:hypothetical protein